MLPGVVEADMIGAFEGLLDKHMNMQGMRGYGPKGRQNRLVQYGTMVHTTLWAEGPISVLYSSMSYVLKAWELLTCVPDVDG
eukprot:g16868.t1